MLVLMMKLFRGIISIFFLFLCLKRNALNPQEYSRFLKKIWQKYCTSCVVIRSMRFVKALASSQNEMTWAALFSATPQPSRTTFP